MVDRDLRRKAKDFSPEEIGNAFLARCAFFDQEEFDYERLTRFETILFHDFQDLIERDSSRYREKCRKNKQNIEKRWAKEKGKDTTEYDRIRNVPNSNSNSNSNSRVSKSSNKDLLTRIKNIASAASASEERRSGQGEPPPAEVVQKILGGLARVRSSEESQKELDEAGFFSMNREEKAAYLERRRRLKKEERKAENEN